MKKYWKKNRLLLALTFLLCTAAALISTFVSLILQRVTDIALSGNMTAFKHMLIFTAAYIAGLCLLNFLASLSSKYLVQKMTRQMRSDIYSGIMVQKPGQFYASNTADYISNLINDVKLLEDNYLLPLLQNISMIAMFAGTLGLLIMLSPMVTGILMICLLFMFAVPALLGKIMEKRQDAVSTQMAVFIEKIKDILSGFEVVRSFRLLPMMKLSFEKENERTTSTKFAADKITALNEGLSDTFSNLSMVVVIFVSAFLVIKGSITMGTLMALIQLSGTFLIPVLLFMENLPKIKGTTPIINKIAEITERKEEDNGQLPVFEEKVSISHLNYSYQKDVPVLIDINIDFEKGKKYALVGPSGCGKSTLIRLMTGYYQDYEGSISYDGTELSKLNSSHLGDILSTLHQNVYLFNDTVRNNICLWQSFDEQHLKKSLESSGVSGFLPLLEKGLDSPAGENGNRLSGGQKQRVALARALIRDASMVILDEGTSAIDKQTAAEIETTLLNNKELTLIAITHTLNPALLRQYDQIIYMDSGKIRSAGGFDQLTAENSAFREFCGMEGEM